MTNLIKTLNDCLDILRNDETIIGEKALYNLNYLLILKLLEPQLVNIKIDEYDYDFENVKCYLKYVRFSNLATSKEINSYCDVIDTLWTNILSEHPYTNKIFNKNNKFDIKKNITFKKILLKLYNLNLTNVDYDILGNSYEDFIKEGVSNGQVLGQFFTQPIIKNIIMDILKPKLHKNGTIDSFCDPTMGTGGFLISYLREIYKQSIKKNIKIDWNDVSNKMYGQEIFLETYQLAVSNMLISTGNIINNLILGDTMKNPITNKFKIICSNPPFGMNINCDELQYDIKNKYIPIQSNKSNSVGLFLQCIIYMLEVKGKCCIVLPNGKDLYSKTNKKMVLIREYLLKTCDLQQIIYLPKGLFNNTGTETCIFYFIKKVECENIIIDNKITTDIYQTQTIKFYNYNIETKNKEFLNEVSINEISNNKYNLNYLEYIKKSNDDNTVLISNICVFLPKSKRPASYGKTIGNYPFYKSSMKLDSYVNECDYTTESIIIGTGGNPNIKYNNNFSCSTDNFILNINTNSVKLKYVYYYLFHNLYILEKGFLGSGIKHISKEYINNIQIPVISLEQQNYIIEYYDKLYELDIFVKNKLNNLITNKLNIDSIKTEMNKLNKIKQEINKIL